MDCDWSKIKSKVGNPGDLIYLASCDWWIAWKQTSKQAKKIITTNTTRSIKEEKLDILGTY